MSSETNEALPPSRRPPKLFPEAPPPLEPAPLPPAILRLRTFSPEPSEPPRRNPDHQRELFYINWKAQNPGGRADSEDFERAFGDFQILQFEAKHPAHDRSSTPLKTIVTRFLLIGILILAAFAAASWLRAKVESGRPVPSRPHSVARPAPATPHPAPTGSTSR